MSGPITWADGFVIPPVSTDASTEIRVALDGARIGETGAIRTLARFADGFRFNHSMTYFQVYLTVSSVDRSLTIDEWEAFMYEADTGEPSS